jgi:hypothetical protein
MKEFGQVIERYGMRGQDWVTIWNLNSHRQHALAAASCPPLKLGQCVVFERSEADCISEVKTVSRSELPAGIIPII